jgi:hypothetical protein
VVDCLGRVLVVTVTAASVQDRDAAVELLERPRRLYPNDGPTLRYAEWLHLLGGQVRTVPTLPVRMIIFDRERGLLPMDTTDATAGAVVLHGQGTVAALCAMFDVLWKTGTALGTAQPLDDHGLAPQEKEFL